ncbi:MAG: hypothetical protein HY747_07700 [Elusimicrobia bacterium]|nr:hypothetical protein [Elusimicrobiota bacterium]
MNKANRYYLGIVILGAAARIIPHPPNFTPTGAIAFFSGSKIINRWIALCVPLAIMILSDAFIGWHQTMPFVYGSFLLCVLLGQRLGQGNVGRLAGLGLSSVVFFITTNLGVWLVSGMYPHTAGGLAACYWAAIPFFRNELAANLIYGGAFYAAAHLIEKRGLAKSEVTC